MKRITIKDIAGALGLSPSTISRALADHPDISAATKARVRDVAEALGYVPNYRARYLRARHSRLIALVLPELNAFFLPSLVSGVSRVLAQNDYSLLVFQSEDALAQERQLLRACVNLSVDGVLLAVASETRDLEHLKPLEAAGTPVVMVDKMIESETVSSVSIDDAQAADRATAYLLDHGHRRIVGVFGDARQRITRNRLEGVRRAHRAAGLQDPVEVEVPLLDTLDERLGEALKAHPEATAVFAMSDELLVHTHHHLVSRGFRVPEDLSLIAISDGLAPTFLHPNVTHLRHAGADVGEHAARLLVSAIGGGVPPADVRLQTTLVELGSVRDLQGS